MNTKNYAQEIESTMIAIERIRQNLLRLQEKYALLEAQVVLQVAELKNGGDKPKYSNEPCRQAALTLALAGDNEVQFLRGKIRGAEASRAFKIAKLEALRVEFKVWVIGNTPQPE